MSTEEMTLTAPYEGQITMAVAKALAQSALLPAGLKGDPASVLLVMLTGRELGIAPMAALQLIYVVQGKPTLSAKLQLALLRRSGHKVREIEVTPDRVVLEGTHAITGDVVTVSYTIEEARASGLANKDNWKNYKPDMVYARASSRLANRLDPAAKGGMYAPEDFDVITVAQPASTPAEREAHQTEMIREVQSTTNMEERPEAAVMHRMVATAKGRRELIARLEGAHYRICSSRCPHIAEARNAAL